MLRCPLEGVIGMSRLLPRSFYFHPVDIVARERRGGICLDGPGKVAQALGLDRSFNGQILWKRGGLELRWGEPPAEILQGPRIGIAYASSGDQEALLRFSSRDRM